MIDQERGTELVTRARQVALAAAQGETTRPALDGDGSYGVFTTLNKNDRLRGCRGYPRPVASLPTLIDAAAIDAAINDSRFPSVSPDEFGAITVDVTILGESEKIDTEQAKTEIELGYHGLVAKKGQQRGLLLPQVAVERSWDEYEFVAAVCQKAGLSSSAWQHSETQIERFPARGFREQEPKGSIEEIDITKGE
ncbi:AmmeMemoRadiSam system protein A [Salinarchaeum sp. IM2453]|uniref:AmmeMemoRadiSam system protein A n=1 Tax=Salinarchaeum sp. IM2453 TaxID=2862870 RepID=UPI001C83AE98|nr:AmmeMemoRadiSam system protein A [Salinarchaeum sp. IM2453]QZA88608.1 AmmeMemoRadiSam system protein A [Salinarchaeum sp. IM2453]